MSEIKSEIEHMAYVAAFIQSFSTFYMVLSFVVVLTFLKELSEL